MRAIDEWGVANKVVFAPEKLEMIHLTRKRGDYSLGCKVSENQTITPVAEASGGQSWQQSSQASPNLRFGLLAVFLEVGLACLLVDVVIGDLIWDLIEGLTGLF
jgi:hypothetical protein